MQSLPFKRRSFPCSRPTNVAGTGRIPVAFAAESRPGSSPLRGAPFVPHSASWTAFLAAAQP